MATLPWNNDVCNWAVHNLYTLKMNKWRIYNLKAGFSMFTVRAGMNEINSKPKQQAGWITAVQLSAASYSLWEVPAH